MRIVVVGATGNIGTALLRRLRALPDGVEIVGVARRAPDEGAPPYDVVSWVTADIADPGSVETLRDAFRGADAVVNLAWAMQPNRDVPAMARVNVGGLSRVLDAAVAAAVPQVVVLSSVGAYSLGPKHRRVDESWPTGGVPSSQYSRQKAAVERLLDTFSDRHPEVVVTRVRPGLVFQPAAGAEIATLFLGRLFPTFLLSLPLPVLPFPSTGIVQAVHADDLADALWRMIEHRAAGAFNVAAEPVLTPQVIAEALDAGRWVPFRAAVARVAVALAWRLRVVALDPGWVDIAVQVPVMSTDRVRDELGWSPFHRADDALAEIVDALARREKGSSLPLQG